MKRFLLLTCALLLCLSGCAARTEPKENPFRLKIHISEYPASDVKWEFHYSYNEQGYLSQIQEYKDGKPGSIQLYETDAWGNILRQTTEETDGTAHISEHTLTLDQDHRIIYDECCYDGVLSSITEAAYDEQGNQTMLNINRIKSLQGEDWISYVDRTYNKQGQLIQEAARWSHDASSGRTITYTYEGDRLIRMEYRTHDDVLIYFTEYSYDETGLIQTAMQYEADETLSSKSITTFDEYGNRLRYEYYLYQEDSPGSGDDVADTINTYTYERIDSPN